ncbi:cell division protein SepF [Mycobacterium sp.]|uniref:cell division protein SepF n=1 Tax=Mycobacterium sp. TaxID=1785 RepID=UPI003A8A00A5
MLKQNPKKISLVINTSKSSLLNVTTSKFEDSKAIVKELMKGNALVIDINEMTNVTAIRMIDFITGSLFIIGGKFKKIANKTYLVAPSQTVLDKFLNQFED